MEVKTKSVSSMSSMVELLDGIDSVEVGKILGDSNYRVPKFMVVDSEA